MSSYREGSQDANGQSDSETLKTLEDGKKNDHQMEMDMQKRGMADQQQGHNQMMDKARLMMEAQKMKQMGQRQAVGAGAKKT